MHSTSKLVLFSGVDAMYTVSYSVHTVNSMPLNACRTLGGGLPSLVVNCQVDCWQESFSAITHALQMLLR